MDRNGYNLDGATLALSALGDFFAWMLGGLLVAVVVLVVGRWWADR